MPKKALIVDDSETIRQMLSFTLRGADFEVTEAQHGQDGLDKLESWRPDLIVTDLNMPVMDGIEFIRCARRLSPTRYVPILMLTTESQPEKKKAGKEAGATGWIVKPFNPESFLAAISKLVV